MPDFETPWTAACQASPSITISQSLLKFMSIELVIRSNHLILSCPLLPLSSVFPEGNGKPLQYSCLENPMNSMKRQKDRTMKDELPRSVGTQCATGDQWRNNSKNNKETEPKQKQHPVELDKAVVHVISLISFL